jgi:hypothetical protein
LAGALPFKPHAQPLIFKKKMLSLGGREREREITRERK